MTQSEPTAPSLDSLPAALEACIHGRGGLTCATHEQIGHLVATVSLLTRGFTDDAVGRRLRSFAFALRDIPASTYAAALERQRSGQLRSVDSEEVLIGVMTGLLSKNAPKQFLPDDFESTMQGAQRTALSELLYWFNILFPSLEEESKGYTDVEEPRHALLREWHLSRVIGAVCAQEVKGRLDQHPPSREVAGLWTRNSQHALDALMRMTGAATKGLSHRPTHTPRRQQDEQRPVMNDEKESVLQFLLWGRVHAKSEDDHPLEVLRKAMDGQFDTVPYEVRLRFIDHLRGEYAEKRGGKVPEFSSIMVDGEPESNRESDEEDSLQGPSRIPTDWVEHEAREIWTRLTFDHQWQGLAKKLIADPRTGPAGKLLRFVLEHPDEDDITDEELAVRLGVTDRTIRNYRKRLEPLKQRL